MEQLMPRYWVDWGDAAYPTIRPEDEAAEGERLETFTEAKQKIIKHFQGQILEARFMIQETRKLRVSDVTPTDTT